MHSSYQPQWPDDDTLSRVRRQLAVLPRLVGQQECDDLRVALARVARREAVIVQAGDCAERFDTATTAAVRARIELLDSAAAIVTSATGVDVVRLGRLGGQYAKPRSTATEVLPDGRVVASYFGDAVNEFAPGGQRTPDPRRLLIAYHCADFTLRLLRTTWSGRPRFARTYTSHEALLLDYEKPLLAETAAGTLGSSGHLLWVGQRTRALHGPHIALAASLSNPVGVKIGPGISPDEACRLSTELNPGDQPGKVVFIARFGARQVRARLAPVVAAVARRSPQVSWICDPMHGNTFRLGHTKTRAVTEIKAEVSGFVEAVTAAGEWPAGLHLEVTPEDVTECVPDAEGGGRARIPRYLSACDPRLNPGQTHDVIEHFTSLL